MTTDAALKIISIAMARIVPELPKPLAPEMFLMRDLGLESIDMLNLLVEIEREIKSPLDLIELLRGRAAEHSYSRDLRIDDLSRLLIERAAV